LLAIIILFVYINVFQKACKDAVLTGKISQEQYVRNLMVQGHTQATAASYYNIEDGEQSAYDVVTGQDTSSLGSPRLATTTPPSLLISPPAIMLAPELVSNSPLHTELPTTSQIISPSLPELITHAVEMLSSPTPSSEESPKKKKKFTMEDSFASIEARGNLIATMTPLCKMGRDHPDVDSPRKRIKGSNVEKSWLFHYYLEASKSSEGSIYSDCLSAIRVNDAARAIFHERHVLNSDRLKTIAIPVIACVKVYEETNVEPEWLLLM
jgi:hypothetical protein